MPSRPFLDEVGHSPRRRSRAFRNWRTEGPDDPYGKSTWPPGTLRLVTSSRLVTGLRRSISPVSRWDRLCAE